MRPRNPYPGYRAFEPEDHPVFFGRETESRRLLERLRRMSSDFREPASSHPRQGFLAVIGPPEVGKSSLVRAGLVPALGKESESRWRIGILRPGADPVGNLAQALADALGADRAALAARLRSGPLGLVDAVRDAGAPAGDKLLVVVDQFEELFRFRGNRREPHAGEEKAFIELLLQAARQSELPVFVVVVMRVQSSKDCGAHQGLRDVVRESHYEVPPMSGDGLESAIGFPAAVNGVKIEPRLTARLRAEFFDSSYTLPTLQHALRRTWDRWAQVEPGDGPLDLPHYEATGTMKTALSRHAKEVHGELGDKKTLVESVFRALTQKHEDGSARRQPASIRELRVACAAEFETIAEIVERFRELGTTLLMPPSTTELDEDTVVDLSYESLARTALPEWSRSWETPLLLLTLSEEKARPGGRSGLARALDAWDVARRLAWLMLLAAPALVAGGHYLVIQITEPYPPLRAPLDRPPLEPPPLVDCRCVEPCPSEFPGIKPNEVEFSVTQSGSTYVVKARNLGSTMVSLKSPTVTPFGDLGQREECQFPWELPAYGGEKSCSFDYGAPLRPELVNVRVLLESRDHWSGELTVQCGDTVVIPPTPGPIPEPECSLAHDSALRALQLPGQDAVQQACRAYKEWSVCSEPFRASLGAEVHAGLLRAWDLCPRRSSTVFEIPSCEDPTYPESKAPVRALALGPHGSLAVGSEDGRVHLFNASTPNNPPIEEISKSPPEPAVRSLAWGPDESWLAAGRRDGSIDLWKVEKAGDSVSLSDLEPLTGAGGIVQSLAFRDRWLASGSSEGVSLWNIEDPRRPRKVTIDGQTSAAVTSVAFSPDGTRLLAATGYYEDPGISVWSLSLSGGWTDSQRLGPACRSLAITPMEDSWLVACGTVSGKVLLIPAFDEPGADVRFLEAHPLESHRADVTAVSFNPGGGLLASSSLDGTVKVWKRKGSPGDDLEVRWSDPPSVLRDHDGWVWTSILSGDLDASGSDWVFSGGEDRTVRVRPTQSKFIFDEVCQPGQCQ